MIYKHKFLFLFIFLLPVSCKQSTHEKLYMDVYECVGDVLSLSAQASEKTNLYNREEFSALLDKALEESRLHCEAERIALRESVLKQNIKESLVEDSDRQDVEGFIEDAMKKEYLLRYDTYHIDN